MLASRNSSNSFPSQFHEKTTEWKSMWISIGMQFVVGIQISVYYMSMWPYLSGIDKTADMDFLGWVIAACNIGCTISNPLYGFWNQKTLSCKWPTICGFLIAAIGQLMYGAIGECSSTNAKWYMLIARIITGLGVGNLAALRAYAATASVPSDRLKAISYGTAGFVLGISFGPAISALFTPIGEKGFNIGSVNFNMYTSAAYLMAILCIIASALMLFLFKENYAGILDNENSEKDESYVIIPKFDLPPAFVCIYLYMFVSMIATNIEVMSTPLTTVLYDWKDSQAILYNGIIESVTCIVSVLVNFAIGKLKIGKIDKRLQIIFGLIIFMLFHLANYPWPFYSGPLHYLPPGSNTTTIGGCLDSYSWCSTTTRIPKILYIFAFIVFFGIAFPFVESPAAALFSEILGPRKQGTMQGLYSFGGSVTPFVSSIILTFLFQHTGYKWIIVFQSVALFFALSLVLIYYKRLVPLKLKPKAGKAAAYKNGVFYSM